MKLATVGYWRVSTDRQGRDGVSLDEQAAAGARWCGDHGCELVATYVEDESAWTKRGARRPAMRQALDFIRAQQGRIRYFLVYDLSRFSRSLFDQLRLQRELAELGVQLTTVTLPLADNAHGRAIAGYLGVTNQLQSDLASEKIQGAMLEVVRRGRSPHLAPVGYVNTRDDRGAKCIALDPIRAPLVRRAFELAAEGWTPTRIAEELERAGLRSRRACRQVRQQEIRAILANPLYAGRVVSRRHAVESLGDHEPLVSEDLFARVQDRLRRRDEATRAAQRPREGFPLRGFLRCEACGAAISASASRSHTGKRYAYYHCWAPACCAVRLRCDEVERSFTAQLARLELAPGFAALVLDQVARQWESAAGEQLAVRARLEADAKRLARRRERLTDLLLDGTLDPETYRSQAERLGTEQDRIRFELAAAPVVADDVAALLAWAKPLLTDVSGLWSRAAVAGKRRIQALVYPSGGLLGSEGLRTLSEASVISTLRRHANGESVMVEQIPPTSNPAEVLTWWREAAEIARSVA